MDLLTFNLLPLEIRAEIAWTKGTFLGIRIEKEYSLVLYYLNDFFSEVWYNATSGEILLVLGFTDQNLLEPYLDMIELSII